MVGMGSDRDAIYDEMRTAACAGLKKVESVLEKCDGRRDERHETGLSCSELEEIIVIGVRTLPSSRRMGVSGGRWLSHVALRVQLLGASGCYGIRLGSQRLPPL